jgi:PhzF family phenazine biosynthesis protein
VAREFRQVDVFSAEPFLGNPVAVVHGADGLSDDEMLRFARWTNLSETTFLLPPRDERADYRVRIFTPGRELPFAGHPTLGTCHAWLEAGGRPSREDVVVQECGAGLVPVRRTPDGLAFAAPPLLRGGPVEEALIGEIAAELGIARGEIVDSQWADASLAQWLVRTGRATLPYVASQGTALGRRGRVHVSGGGDGVIWVGGGTATLISGTVEL